MNKKDAKKLLSIYLEGKLSEKLEARVRGWIVNGEQEQIEEVLAEHMDEEVRYRKPSAEEYRKLRRLNERLGFPTKKSATIPLWKRPALRVAAVLLPFFLLTGTFFLMRDSVPEVMPYVAQATVVVAEGQQDYILLPDGSKVWINESTELSYSEDFTDNREVHLSGEAYFSVVHTGNDSPFRVKTDAFTVKVLGTEFNVKDYPEDPIAEVTLTRGLVEVATGTGAGQITRLEPNIQAVVDRVTKKMYTREVVPEEVRWATGGRTFENASLQEVFRYLAAHYRVIFAVDDRLPDTTDIRLPVKGTEDLEQVLRALQVLTSNRFTYEIEGDTVIIEPGSVD